MRQEPLLDQQEPSTSETLSVQDGYYLSRQGDIPFFDHPLLMGHKLKPNNYRPLTSHAEIFSKFKLGQVTEEDVQIMKIVGDAIAIHEDQLRRIMVKAGYTASQTSKKLNELRRLGFVTRWKVRLEHDLDETIKPPAPFTLDVAGYILLTELYPNRRYMRSESWHKYPIPALQRYVSINELRTAFIEHNILRDWQWNIGMNYQNHLPKVTGLAKIETPQGDMHFLIERAQMAQNFVGFLRHKVTKWRNHYQEAGTFNLNRMKSVENPVVVLYCSTYTMAKHIHHELILDQLPFTVLMCVEEDYMMKNDLSQAFYEPSGDQLKAVALPFLSS